MSLSELAERIPAVCSWATGSGTRQSFAQIIPPNRRNFSWYAVADTEEDALRKAIAQMEAEGGA